MLAASINYGVVSILRAGGVAREPAAQQHETVFDDRLQHAIGATRLAVACWEPDASTQDVRARTHGAAALLDFPPEQPGDARAFRKVACEDSSRP
jgi:hypothetical protein